MDAPSQSDTFQRTIQQLRFRLALLPPNAPERWELYNALVRCYTDYVRGLTQRLRADLIRSVDTE